MIHTPRQLKALVRNMSKGDSTKAQIIIRNYIMERFLERLSISKYRDNLILKGGALVSSMVGLDNRSTMDIDATIKNLPLSVENAGEIVAEIASREAFANTSKKRGSISVVCDAGLILDEVQGSPEMIYLWSSYQKKFDYAADVTWEMVMYAVRTLAGKCGADVAGRE